MEKQGKMDKDVVEKHVYLDNDKKQINTDIKEIDGNMDMMEKQGDKDIMEILQYFQYRVPDDSQTITTGDEEKCV